VFIEVSPDKAGECRWGSTKSPCARRQANYVKLNCQSPGDFVGYKIHLLSRPQYRSDPELHLTCDRLPAAPLCAKAGNPRAIHNDGRAPKTLAFGPGVSQAGFHPLLDERPFELRHGTDDLKHQSARGRAKVKVVPQTDERNSAGPEFGQGIDQVTK